MVFLSKRMRVAAKRKATRPRIAKHRSAKTKVHKNVYKSGGKSYTASSMVFLNPNTKIGREYSVDFYPREGWVFNRGHARSTWRFHKTRSAAMEEMRNYAERNRMNYKPGKVK